MRKMLYQKSFLTAKSSTYLEKKGTLKLIAEKKEKGRFCRCYKSGLSPNPSPRWEGL
jgi:hypothetical protein